MMSKAMGRGHSQNAALGSLFLGTSKFNPGLVGLFYFILFYFKIILLWQRLKMSAINKYQTLVSNNKY
jgi:hypothetical protein